MSLAEQARRVVAELRAWAARGWDGWDVDRARHGRAIAPPWAGERGRASAARGREAQRRARL